MARRYSNEHRLITILRDQFESFKQWAFWEAEGKFELEKENERLKARIKELTEDPKDEDLDDSGDWEE